MHFIENNYFIFYCARVRACAVILKSELFKYTAVIISKNSREILAHARTGAHTIKR